MNRMLLAVCLAPVLALCFAAPDAWAGIKVVATIKPIHSLAASILEGVSEPVLLLQGAASPHTYALKPSDLKALTGADVIIRVSPNLEVFLDKTLKSLPETVRVITLQRAPGLSLLPVRTEGHGGGKSGSEDAPDVHFWLDPRNAIAIAKHLDGEFSREDPDHAGQYHANAEALEARLAALDQELTLLLTGLGGRPFFVFHDVTQYLERRYGLTGLGAVTASPEREPGAGRLQIIRGQISGANAICLFSEPEFPPKLIGMLTDGTAAKTGVLDEIGAGMAAGKEQYIELMRDNAQSLAACLKP
jgi:zinc transport system substrate-binding protein